MKYVLLLAGFVLLIKGADFFVDGASIIAKRLKIPSVIIGLTIVAFGTSAPEASVSVVASLRGNNGIAVGNIIGSNMFNLLMVIGFCAMIKPVKIEKSLMIREFPLSILATFVLIVLSLDTFLSGQSEMVLTRGDGIILLSFFAIFIYSMIGNALSSRKEGQGQVEKEDKELKSFPISILMLVIGLVGIIVGGELTVDSASKIATAFGMSDALIGLTIVAIGTSLPEFVTSVVAIRKGEDDLAFGNVIGSNLFNLLFVLGLSATISNVEINILNIYDMLMLLVVNCVIYIFAFRKKRISRPLGILMAISYILYMAYAVIR